MVERYIISVIILIFIVLLHYRHCKCVRNLLSHSWKHHIAKHVFVHMLNRVGLPRKTHPYTWYMGHHKICVQDSEYCIFGQFTFPYSDAKHVVVSSHTSEIMLHSLTAKGYSPKCRSSKFEIKIFATSTSDLMVKYKCMKACKDNCFYDIFMDLYSSFSIFDQNV
jgi:hypothetical protein